MRFIHDHQPDVQGIELQVRERIDDEPRQARDA